MSVPVFGDQIADDAQTFELVIHDPQTSTKLRERFATYRDPGGGIVIAFMRAGGDAERQLAAAAQLVFQALVDTDGLSESYVPPGPDDEDDVDGRLADVSQWSSRRRFGYYADSPRYRVSTQAILDLATWIAREAFGRRPTVGPSPSSRGQTPTESGSEDKPYSEG